MSHDQNTGGNIKDTWPVVFSGIRKSSILNDVWSWAVNNGGAEAACSVKAPASRAAEVRGHHYLQVWGQRVPNCDVWGHQDWPMIMTRHKQRHWTELVQQRGNMMCSLTSALWKTVHTNNRLVMTLSPETQRETRAVKQTPPYRYISAPVSWRSGAGHSEGFTATQTHERHLPKCFYKTVTDVWFSCWRTLMRRIPGKPRQSNY